MSSTHAAGTSHGNIAHRSHHRFLDRNGVGVYPWWYGYGLDYPDDVTTYPSDNSPSSSVSNIPGAASSTSPFDSNAARATMNSIGSRAAAELYSSPQWESATADLKQATAELAAAKDRIAQVLNSRPDYRAALEQKQEAQQLAAALHEQGASLSAVWPVAQRDLEASTTLTRLQREAMAGEPELVHAQDRLQAAVAARRSLQEGLRAQIMNDPQWQQARQELDQTR